MPANELNLETSQAIISACSPRPVAGSGSFLGFLEIY